MKNAGCVTRTAGQKKEAGVTVYLMEELGDARMRCDQLVRYITEAFKLIESSGQREQLFEVGGHLIHAIPDALFRLQKALQAVALAADRLDYEELKNDLRPEKVQELERVLQEVRIRNVQHRSQPLGRSGSQDMKNAADWKLSADEEKKSRFEEGKPADPTENMSEEDAKKWKSENEKNKDNFKAAAAEFWKPVMDEDPKKVVVVWVRPGNQRDGEAHAFKEATFEDGSTVVNNVSLCGKKFQGMAISKARAHGNVSSEKCSECEKKQSRSAALVWKIDAAAALSVSNVKDAAAKIEAKAKEVQKLLAKGEITEQVYDLFNDIRGASSVMVSRLDSNMSKSASALDWKAESAKVASDDMPDEILPNAVPGIERIVSQARLVGAAASSKKMFFAMLGVLDGIAQVGRTYEVPKVGLLMQVRKEMVAYSGARPTNNFSASEDDKRSKFEEGKPADPTENMSEEDAKKWKLENLKNKDNFKSALDWKAEAKKLLDKRKGTDQDDLHYRAYLRAIIDGQPAEHLTKKYPGAQAAKEDLIDETGKAPKTAAEVTKEEWAKALKNDEATLRRLEDTIKKLETGEKVENYDLAAAKAMLPSLKQVIENKKKLISKLSSEAVDPLAWKVEAKTSWTSKGETKWVTRVQYAGSNKPVEWEIQSDKDQTEFSVYAYGVKSGVDYKAKKDFPSLKAAQKFAEPFLVANDLDDLEDSFKKV